MRSRKLLALLFCLITFPAIAGYMTLLGAGVGSIAPVVSWVSTTDAFPSSSLTYSGPSLSTMFDSTGKLTFKPNNLLTYSNTFSNAAWTKTASSVTANATTDPVGGNSAWKLVESAATAWHWVGQQPNNAAVGTNFIQFIYAKAAERSVLGVDFSGVVEKYSYFDLTNGTVLSSAAGSNSTISSAGNGWWKIGVQRTSDLAATNFMFFPTTGNGTTSYAGDGSSGVYIYLAGVSAVTYETAPRTADQVITTSSAYYGPRIDYDPNTLAVKGLLIEEARTNYLVAANDLSNVAWSGGTRAAGVATGIDGLTSMNRATMAAGTTQVYQTVTQAAGNYAGAAYFKAETGATWIYFQLSDGPGNGYRVWFNLSTGAIGSNTTIGTGQSGLTSSVTPVGNGVYRFNVNGNIPNSTKQILFAAVRADGSVSTTNNDTVLFTYGTLEPGTFPTSPIPTTAASVTRAADVVQFTGAALTALKASTASFIAQIKDYNVNTYSAFLGDGGANNFTLYANVANNIYTSNGTNSLTLGNTSTTFRAGLAWSGAGRSAVMNGGTVQTDANLIYTGTPTNLYLGSMNSSYFLNGHIASFAIYNQRLPDATLQAKSVVGASYAANDNGIRYAFADNDNLPIHWRVAL